MKPVIIEKGVKTSNLNDVMQLQPATDRVHYTELTFKHLFRMVL